MKQRGMIDVGDLPPELQYGSPAGSDYLPVPLGMAPGTSIDMGILATSILELRQDIQEMKSMLAQFLGRADESPAWDGESTGRLDPRGKIEETFGGGAGFSPITEEGGGDLQTAEKSLMEAALKASGGNRRQAAERLGISERTLYRKIKLYGLG
jgi:DNA-binding NtrC family response regulator